MAKSSLRWFHVVITAYGNWLPGDPRGFRTKHHREHVEGDYRNRPTEDYSLIRERSERLMRFAPVTFASADRGVIREALVAEAGRRVERLAAVAVGATHGHLLIRLDRDRPKFVVGRYKTRASYALKEFGTPHVKTWAKGCKCKPIADSGHWDHAFAYILRHEADGAAVWRWDGPSTAFGDEAVAWDGVLTQREENERARREKIEREELGDNEEKPPHRDGVASKGA